MLSDPFIPPPRFDLTSEEGVELVEVGGNVGGGGGDIGGGAVKVEEVVL